MFLERKFSLQYLCLKRKSTDVVRMQEVLQNPCTGNRGSESRDREDLSCIWVIHRKVWGFAEVMDHIDMYKLIEAANDKMSFHKVFGSYRGGNP